MPKSSADLKAIDAEPLGKGVAQKLGHVLGLAAKGEISSVAIAVVYRDGAPGWFLSDIPNTSTLLGSIERMKYYLIVSKDG